MRLQHLLATLIAAVLALAGPGGCKKSEEVEEAAAPPPKAEKAKKSGKAAKGDEGDKAATKGDKGDKAAAKGDEDDKAAAKADKDDKAAAKGDKDDKAASKGDEGAKGGAADRAAKGAADRAAKGAADRAAKGAASPKPPAGEAVAAAERGEKGVAAAKGGAAGAAARAQAARPVADEGAAIPVTDSGGGLVAGGAHGMEVPAVQPRPTPAARPGTTQTAERLAPPEQVAPPLRPVEAPRAERAQDRPQPRPASAAEAARAAREAQSAAVRLAPQRPAGPPLDVSQALTVSELKVLSGGKAFRQATLLGREGDPSYNSLYFEPVKSQAYGVGVQVWYEPTIRDTRTRYEDMKGSYPNVQETGNVTNYTFFAFWNDVYYLVFMGLKQRLVISVTASSDTITPNQLFAVATKVRDRLVH